MGGPAFEPVGNSSVFRFPNYYKGVPLFYEWSRDYIKEFRLNGRKLGEIRPFPVFVDNPMDMEFGPDGSLYVLEYGDGYFAENPDAQLSKINFVRGNHSPIAKIAAEPNERADAPLEVKFSSAGTNDPDGDAIAYAWDFQSDGTVDSTEANPTFSYTAKGTYNASLKVTDRTGRTGSTYVRVLVGNAEPVVELTVTTPTSPFQFGDDRDLRRQGHRRHAGRLHEGHRGLRARPRDARPPAVLDRGLHRLRSRVPLDSGHAGASNLSAVFVASYTDPGEDGTPGLTGTRRGAPRPGRAGPDADAARRALADARSVAAQRSSWAAAAAGPGLANAHAATSAARSRSAGLPSARRTASRTPHGVQKRGASRTPTPAQSTRAAFSAMSPPAGQTTTGQPETSARASVPWPPCVITRSQCGIVRA